MVTIIKYQDIKDLKPLDVVVFLLRQEKYTLNQLEPIDLLKKDVFNQKFVDQYYNWLFVRGIYLFFTPNNEVIYIGKAKDGFYGRFMGHITTEFKANFGWNSILRKMGGNRLKVQHNELNTKEHETDLQELLHYKLLLIDVGYDELDIENNCLSKQQLGWLESILMRAFDYQNGEKLLNTKIGKLSKQEMDSKIQDWLT